MKKRHGDATETFVFGAKTGELAIKWLKAIKMAQ
jgi:hypothetical protein